MRDFLMVPTLYLPFKTTNGYADSRGRNRTSHWKCCIHSVAYGIYATEIPCARDFLRQSPTSYLCYICKKKLIKNSLPSEENDHRAKIMRCKIILNVHFIKTGLIWVFQKWRFWKSKTLVPGRLKKLFIYFSGKITNFLTYMEILAWTAHV